MRALVFSAAAFLPRTPSPSANPSHRTPPRAAALSRHPSGRDVAAAAAAATGDYWNAGHHQYHGDRGGSGRKSAAGSYERAGPTVQCGVDVVSWRERRVFASVAVAADVDTVWRVITDY
ncbi:hypothetical protein GUJ93_ZPchr0013g36069 [Zizania palustris]|uniref:Uncharacterized protein n=1 Tax=Zizania palustris TaxID=103762 RepID=A0A8J6BY70_ZIZPA|nr:hypothetical protein GUJ93_ZPchr0013g36069 [Zizania palustris]